MGTRARFMILLLSAAPAILAGACAPQEQPPKERQVAGKASRPQPYAGKLRLHWDGETLPLEISAAQGRRLEAMAAQLVGAADNMMRLAVTPELVRGYYAKSRSAELIFPEPKKLTVGFSGQEIVPQRLFFMLEGELTQADGDGLVILCGYPDYSAGPLVVSEGRQQLGALLAELR